MIMELDAYASEPSNRSARNQLPPPPPLISIEIDDVLGADEVGGFSGQVALISLLILLVMLIGLVGNALNILVFSKRTMRRHSTFRFLLYLSVIDTLVILLCCTDALAHFGFNFEIRLISSTACCLHTFITYFLPQSSSNILMIVSIDRALVMARAHPPFKQQQKQQRSVAKSAKSSAPLVARCHRVDAIMALLFAALAALNAHYFLYLELNSRVEEASLVEFEDELSRLGANLTGSSWREESLVCFPLKVTRYAYFLTSVWPWVDLCIFFLVPFVVMTVCSAMIVVRIRRSSQRFFRVLANKRNPSNKLAIYRRVKRNRLLLYMLLLTNFSFLVSSLPYSVAFIVYNGEKINSLVGQAIIHLVLYTSNSFNFVLYGFFSEKYREELFKMICFRVFAK